MLIDSFYQSRFSIDHVWQIFKLTIGSIKGSGGIVLWTWATRSGMTYDFRHLSQSCLLALAWFAVVCLGSLVAYINTLLVYRFFGQWEIDSKYDRVLITGGSNGLGLLLAANFAASGFKVEIFDLDEPEFPLDCGFHKVDVSDEHAVHREVKDLPGSSYIVVNCAGTVGNSTGRFKDVSIEETKSVMNTNLLGAIWTTRAMLKHKNVKMVVGVSSSIALACPAQAAIYAASKAGVRAFYASLHNSVYSHTQKSVPRVLWISPGQLDTRMFSFVKTPSEFFSPVIRAAPLSKVLYDSILNGQTGEIFFPMYAGLLPFVNLLPTSLVGLLRLFIGVDSAIDLDICESQ